MITLEELRRTINLPKVGDKVRILSIPPRWNENGRLDRYVGEIMTLNYGDVGEGEDPVYFPDHNKLGVNFKAENLEVIR